MIRRVMVVLVSVVALLAVRPEGAGAVSGCSGTGYPQQTYSHGGAVVAVLCFSNYGNGVNATLESVGKYDGVPKTMSLKVCRWGSSGPYSCVTDSGTFSYYAGPLHRPGGCEYYKSVMWNGQGTRIVNDEWVLCN